MPPAHLLLQRQRQLQLLLPPLMQLLWQHQPGPLQHLQVLELLELKLSQTVPGL